MENEQNEEDKIGFNPVQDRLQDLRASVLCLAGALIRAGVLTQDQVNQEAQQMLDSFGVTPEEQELWLPALDGLSRMGLRPAEQDEATPLD